MRDWAFEQARQFQLERLRRKLKNLEIEKDAIEMCNGEMTYLNLVENLKKELIKWSLKR